MRRFNIVQNGYDVEEVNRFIDVVIKRLERLNEENKQLNLQIQKMGSYTRENINIDEKISKAIVAAQETTDKMKEMAKAESKLIIDDAKRNANAIVHEALVEAAKTNNESALLKKNVTVYKNRIKNIIKAQLELAEDLDKYDF